MIRTRQIQLWRAYRRDWAETIEVADFTWEEPDVIILDAKGIEVRRYRIGEMEEYWGWRGGTVWKPERHLAAKAPLPESQQSAREALIPEPILHKSS